jgi:hypothetical protein
MIAGLYSAVGHIPIFATISYTLFLNTSPTQAFLFD